MRTGLAVAVIAIAQLALLVSAALGNGYADAMVTAITGPMMGHVQVHHPRWREQRGLEQTLSAGAEKVQSVLGVRGVVGALPRVYSPVIVALGEEGRTGLVIGIDGDSERGANGLLGDSTLRPTGTSILIGKAFAERSGAKVGDEVAVIGQRLDGSVANDLFQVAGVVQTSVEAVQRDGLLMDLAEAQRLFGMDGAIHEIIVHAGVADETLDTREHLMALSSLGGTEVLSWQEAAPELVAMVGMARSFGFLVLILVMLAASSGVMNTLLMATSERTREFGVLMSIGTSPGGLVKMIVAESAVLGGVGVALGCLVGGVVVKVASIRGVDLGAAGEISVGGLNYQSLIHPHLLAENFVLGIVAVLITAVVCATWPAWKVTRLDPSEAVRA